MFIIFKLCKNKHIEISILFTITLFFVSSLFFIDYNTFVKDIKNTVTNSNLLLTGSTSLGGFGISLLLTSFVGMFTYVIAKISNVKFQGLIFAAMILQMGFAFIGKNVLNVIPIYLGTMLYAKHKKDQFRDFFPTAIFATGIVPFISYFIYSGIMPLPYNWIVAIFIGLLIGFVTPSIALSVLRAHDGYTLHNTGFAIGFLGLLGYGFLSFFEKTSDRVNVLTVNYHTEFLILFSILVAFLLVYPFFLKTNFFKNIIPLFKKSGRVPSDFVNIFDQSTAIFNAGLMGLLSILTVLVLQVEINELVIAAMLSVLGFGMFGNHITNSVPIMLGVYLGSLFLDIDSATLVATMLFATALAPISGTFTSLVGVVAGFTHIVLTSIIINTHGGFVLYNNGFTTGFVATIIVAFVHAIKRERNIDDEVELHETHKLSRIGQECVNFYLFNHINCVGIKYMYTSEKSTIILVVKSIHEEYVDRMIKLLNLKERNHVLEETYWELLGESTDYNQLDLVGVMIDEVSKQDIKNDDAIEITLLRRLR